MFNSMPNVSTNLHVNHDFSKKHMERWISSSGSLNRYHYSLQLHMFFSKLQTKVLVLSSHKPISNANAVYIYGACAHV